MPKIHDKNPNTPNMHVTILIARFAELRLNEVFTVLGTVARLFI